MNRQYVTSHRYQLNKSQDPPQKHPYEKTIIYVKSEQNPTLKSPHPHSVKQTNLTSVPVNTSHIYMKLGESQAKTSRVDSGYASSQGNTHTSPPRPKSASALNYFSSVSQLTNQQPAITTTLLQQQSPRQPYSSQLCENHKPAISVQTGPKQNMSYYTTDIISPTSLARKQEKEDLQMLNERFSTYVSRVRELCEHNNQLDSASFIKQTQILEEEVANLKTLYERELDAIR